LFQHYAGQPFADRSDKEFRVIKEGFTRVIDSDIVDSGHIFAKLEYSKKEVKDEFWRLLYKKIPITKQINTTEVFETLSRNFVIYPKESKTLSGK
jgi:hypothetical protein